MSSGGCESIGRGCAWGRRICTVWEGLETSNELWNVMYDCITGQVILSAAALAIEVLSWVLSPCVPRSMNHRGCAVTYTLPMTFVRSGRWGTSWNFMHPSYEGYQTGGVLWRSIDCVTIVMCSAIPFIPRYIHLWGYDWAGLHQVII